MIGYVLWSDATAAKAIIWCEDQGDLAYYLGKNDSNEMIVCKGDWIQFELTEGKSIRLAANARVLDEEKYPELADMLIEAAPIDLERAATVVAPDGGCNVIPFPTQRKRSKTIRYG